VLSRGDQGHFLLRRNKMFIDPQDFFKDGPRRRRRGRSSEGANTVKYRCRVALHMV